MSVFFHAGDCECSSGFEDYVSVRDEVKVGGLMSFGKEYRQAYRNHGIE